jgi:anti-sigma B factor antagonist
MKIGLIINETENGPVQVVHVEGYLDGHTFGELEQRLDQLLTAGRVRLVIELSKLTYIASSGVGVFINFQSQASAKGGNLQLVNPSPSVHEIFDLLGLDSLFVIHPTVDKGIEAANS